MFIPATPRRPSITKEANANEGPETECSQTILRKSMGANVLGPEMLWRQTNGVIGRRGSWAGIPPHGGFLPNLWNCRSFLKIVLPNLVKQLSPADAEQLARLGAVPAGLFQSEHDGAAFGFCQQVFERHRPI